ncbi:MAG: N-acetyl-gamma-glutamyl-phosphate reductase [Phycisphaerales bacterium]|nr:N-acetyl-gamma-glutamyl-phosphate reductase [Phycisphaerales bacterium]
MSTEPYTIGVVGARGYVGRELLACIERHPRLALGFAWSRQLAGAHAATVGAAGSAVAFAAPAQDKLQDHAVDVLVLALPNGLAREYVEAATEGSNPPRLIIDLSADYRFDDAWAYGLTEHNGAQIRDAHCISNPGCYATAMQLALRPLIDCCAAAPNCFGVSGFSGAGTSPSERNDPDVLRDNILPYALTNHLHEREVARQLCSPIRFAPSVASFPRGIMLTAQLTLREPIEVGAIHERYATAYGADGCVSWIGDRMPRLQDVVETPRALVGGLHIHPEDPTRVAVVCALDNLMKGAATQAMQNINLALDMPEDWGLR